MKRSISIIMFVLMACMWSQGHANNQKLPSLCDEWNILSIAYGEGHKHFHTSTLHLTTDTVINGLHYLRLEQNEVYLGALREGDNKEIYYLPNATTHEYLLYAFNAKTGDHFSNLWYGGDARKCPNGYNATLKKISESTPRVFTIEVEYPLADSNIPYSIYWIEGVGMADGPVGQDCPGPECEGDYDQHILCAYKEGEQVYASELSKQYGCEYNYSPLQDVETIISSPSATKILHDGQMFILLDKKVYNAQGTRMQ